ncbi:ABC transporter substrate-binding protein [Olsenella sp. HMSC062G07]|uniref:ABC transporter substrate-binding protein n=1 Tax=Olsenella sp. HMSC062G07 TaxID=1739330 RepID=UPI0008A118B8|nr:ABC transporter substrate-binding protein [Olsenella sp. HMSC062G07]OFK23561.1 ABC transporter substrate-binding protein [Olsenella sp. HMSC062G07]
MDNKLTRRDALRLMGGLGALGVALPALSACSGAAPSAGADGYRIGVLQLTEHAALDAAHKGFFKALDASGIAYQVDDNNAQNDQSACQTIATKLVNAGEDLILAIATPAAQAVAGATTDIPIIGTAITDFAASGLVASNEKPGNNVTGSSDLTPVAEQFDLLAKLFPAARTVGVLYCTAESNSDVQVKLADEAAASHGLAVTHFSVSSSNEIQQVVESMVGKVDVAYAPTDNTIAAGMTTVAMVATDNGLPFIVGDVGMVENGGLATYGINYEELGKLAGQMAVKVLKGESKPADMPIQHLDVSKCALVSNKKVAEKLDVDLSVLGDSQTQV